MPVTEDIAIKFAALQVQVQFGDHREEKHKPGFLTRRYDLSYIAILLGV